MVTPQMRPWYIRRLPLALTLLAILVLFLLIEPYSPGGIQRRNMAKARAHIPKIEALIKNDARFSRIILSDYTANHGSLLVRGDVPTNRDREDLEKLIESTHPPTKVAFTVGVEQGS